MMEVLNIIISIYSIFCAALGAFLLPVFLRFSKNLRNSYYRDWQTLKNRFRICYKIISKKEYGSCTVISTSHEDCMNFHKGKVISIQIDRINMTEYEKLQIMKGYVEGLDEMNKDYIKHGQNITSLLHDKQIDFRI